MKSIDSDVYLVSTNENLSIDLAENTGTDNRSLCPLDYAREERHITRQAPL